MFYLLLLHVFIYVFWCPTQFSYHMTLVLFISDTTCGTSGAGIVYLSAATALHSRVFFVSFVLSVVSCVLISRSLFMFFLLFFFCHCIVCTSLYGF